MSGPDLPTLGSDPSPDGRALHEVSLTELRAYRTRLREEEERASYWRRLLHARLDLLEAGSTSGSVELDDLARILGDTGSGATRTALLHVRAADELPELPVLGEVWINPTDDGERAEALTRLRGAEGQLTAYRSALHARIDEATAELIRRYREQPSAALVALG